MNKHSLTARSRIDAAKQALADAMAAADSAAAERRSYTVNPALRGAQSVSEAENDIRERAGEAVRAAKAKGEAALVDAVAELGEWRRLAEPNAETCDRAWSLRGAPILAGGGKIADVIAFAVRVRDAELLHGALRNAPAHAVAGLGGFDGTAERAIDATIADIEKAQEDNALASEEVIEQRRFTREAFALQQEFHSSLELAAKVAIGSARGADRMAAGYRQNDTQRAADGDRQRVEEPIGA